MRQPVIYMLTNRKNSILYTGMTTNLPRRIEEHKNHVLPGFTSTYRVDKLVYVESADTLDSAYAREKQLKRWRRDWKVALIERDNPDWRDLAGDAI